MPVAGGLVRCPPETALCQMRRRVLLRRRRSAWAVRRSEFFLKPKQKSLVASLVAHDFPLRRAEELVAQGEPASQLRRSLLHRPGPAASSEKTFHFCKTRILPQREERYARPLRDDQLEIAGFGEANNDVADKSPSRRRVQQLTRFGSPTSRRLGELMMGE